jgi:hypothetical protein
MYICIQNYVVLNIESEFNLIKLIIKLSLPDYYMLEREP